MKPFLVEVTAEATEDLIKIWAAIAYHNPVAADEFLRRLDIRIDSLTHLPVRGVPRDDLMIGLRMLVEGNYLVFYRINSSKVEVLRVLHGSQDLPRLFN